MVVPDVKRIISSSEIIGLFTKCGGEFEVCACGEANFDELNAQLVTELDSFIRPADPRAREKHLPADWLPRKQTIIESVSLDEAPELAKELFHRWVARVRESVPSPMHN